MIDSSNFLRYSGFEYLVFDYETCDVNLQSLDNKPWQVSFLLKRYSFDGNKSKITELERGDIFLKWNDLKLSAGAERVTKFNRKKYDEIAQDPKPILDKINSIFYDDKTYIVGHNSLGFDIYIHNIFRRLMGMKPDYSFVGRFIDTHALSKLYKLEMDKPEDMSLIEWQVKILNTRNRGLKTNLKIMCKEFGIEVDDSKLHDSMYDVEKTDELFLKLIWAMKI